MAQQVVQIQQFQFEHLLFLKSLVTYCGRYDTRLGGMQGLKVTCLRGIVC